MVARRLQMSRNFVYSRSLLIHRAILVDEWRKGGNVDSLSKFCMHLMETIKHYLILQWKYQNEFYES